MDKVEAGTETVSVHDLEDFTAVTIWQGAADGLAGRSMTGFSYDGNMIASRKQPDNTAKPQILGLGAQRGLLSTIDFRSTPDQIVRVQYAPNDNYVIASVHNSDGISRSVCRRYALCTST